MRRIKKEKKFQVFFDFDNTIATVDTFDSMLPVFAKSDRWVKLEQRWVQGQISSKECLEGQLNCMELDRERLNLYLSGIKLDPYFKKLVKFLESRRIKSMVLSDNFDYILKKVLKYNEVKNIKVYSNILKFINSRPIALFPFRHKRCPTCAHCKTKNLLANTDSNSSIVYIGDGRSDFCPVKYADIVFAKDALLKYCREQKLKCYPYKSLKDVYNYFKRSLS
ncbi:MAG: MtnX-like HAD-IB family phosphatase [Candidatus Omnitrophica bacterium]|nr:MtnX-like HAD-IB family phosphatase [Candidatus Omnitrophota bacterium]MBU1869680.1 MtnX-like HAD-IB family phosphatase [Candidatus Omnitrophota bacterium]